MKKIAFIVLSIVYLSACKKGDPETLPVQLDTPFTIKVNQTAELETDGMKITLLEITEDSRCPASVECIVAGRLVAEFKVEKDGQGVVRNLAEDPSGDPAYSDEFEAFGHVVRLEGVQPQAEVETTPQKDYFLKIRVA